MMIPLSSQSSAPSSRLLRNTRSQGATNRINELFSEDFFNLADFPFHCAFDFFRSTTIR
jgi:hypothetical protein